MISHQTYAQIKAVSLQTNFRSTEVTASGSNTNRYEDGSVGAISAVVHLHTMYTA